MKIVSLDEIRAFILAQPDDKPLDLYDGDVERTNGPGCVLVHYCQQNKIKFSHCMFSYVSLGEEIVLRLSGHGVLDVYEADYAEEKLITNYGALKPHLVE